MNKERLLAIASMLDEVQAGTWRGTLPVDEFNINTWVSQSDCGTSACAIGHAALDPRFDWIETTTDLDADPLGTIHFGLEVTEDSGDEEDEEEDDVAAALGLSNEDFNFLFMPSFYMDGEEPTAANVAARVREFVATDGESSKEIDSE